MSSFPTRHVDKATRLLALGEVAEIADHLRRGFIAILPTETGYMIAARADREAAVARVFAAKRREFSEVFHVAFADLAMVGRYAVPSLKASRILSALTPGPITVIVPQRDSLPSRGVTIDGTVGVRIPACPVTLQILAATDVPLTATSLNVAKDASFAPDSLELLEKLDWPNGAPTFVVLDYSSQVYSEPSTLVRVLDSSVEVLRSGPVDEETVNKCAGRMSYQEVREWT